jgi:hypothetical protein
MASVLPYASLAIVSAIGGMVVNALEVGGLSRTAAGKTVSTAGFCIQAGFLYRLIGLGGSTYDMYAAIVYLTLAVGSGGLVLSGGYWCSYLDMSSQHGMVLLAVGNSISTLAGIAGQDFTGWVLSVQPGNWGLVYKSCVIADVFGAVIFLAFGARSSIGLDSSGESRPCWNEFEQTSFAGDRAI